ncbi:uncharacterized protein [Antedon mediterranea]|uniref:uncharacterized protein n=1 Tax=Antedon mediterranea TaxID=105859 RepID=UPI003AF51B4A
MLKAIRGNNWTDREVKELIELWKDPDLRKEIDSNKKRCKLDTWYELATRLANLGYPTRSGPQIHNKINDLRRSYQRAKVELNDGSDRIVVMRQYPFYEMLKKVIVDKKQAQSEGGENSFMSGIECDGQDDDSSIDETLLDDTNSSNSINFALSDDDYTPNKDGETSGVGNTESKQFQENTYEDLTNQGKDGEPHQAKGSESSQQSRSGKKRQRVSLKDRTVEALAKKMKDITAESDKKFLMIEEKRRREDLEQRREDRKCMMKMMELIKDSMEERKQADERRRKDFEALMEVLGQSSSSSSKS